MPQQQMINDQPTQPVITPDRMPGNCKIDGLWSRSNGSSLLGDIRLRNLLSNRAVRLALVLVCLFALYTKACGYDELEQEVVDLRNEAYALIEVRPSGDTFFLGSTKREICDRTVFLSDLERGKDLSKVAELSRGVYPKMEPAAQHYEREGWSVARIFYQYVPGEFPVFGFAAFRDFRRVTILVNGGSIEISIWAGPGCIGLDGSDERPLDNEVDKFPNLEDLLDE